MASAARGAAASPADALSVAATDAGPAIVGALDPTPRVIGRYTLAAPLAAGGMATVHLGRLLGSAGFSRTVAIKRLHREHVHESSLVEMFLDEARLVARIKHPNVVPTLDVVTADGELFIVMDYVQGESLSRLLKATVERDEEIPPRIAATVLAGVLHGLHAAHDAESEHGEPLGIVHRDVSPQNVLVGVDGVARVLDFGIARAFGRHDRDLRREPALMGKLAYMAPEQIRRQKLDRRADVYAAAVVLWETLSRRRLFRGDTNEALVHQILEAPLASPSTNNPAVTSDVDAVVMRGLARNPNHRWATAREMALALEQCVPPETSAHVGQWVQGLAASALAERAALVAEVESASAPVSMPPGVILEQLRPGRTATKPDDVPTVVEKPRELTATSSARWAAIAIGAVAGGIVAAVLFVKGC